MKNPYMTNRVGSSQWLILGALAQAPNLTLPLSVLYDHATYKCGVFRPHVITRSLVKTNRVSLSHDGLCVTLTEYGASSGRNGRSGVVKGYVLLGI